MASLLKRGCSREVIYWAKVGAVDSCYAGSQATVGFSWIYICYYAPVREERTWRKSGSINPEGPTKGVRSQERMRMLRPFLLMTVSLGRGVLCGVGSWSL